MSEYIYGGVAIEHGAAKGETRLERREEIVRCRDCRYFHPMEGSALSCRLPHPQYGHLVPWQFAEPDGYCWRGERKEGGE